MELEQGPSKALVESSNLSEDTSEKEKEDDKSFFFLLVKILLSLLLFFTYINRNKNYP